MQKVKYKVNRPHIGDKNYAVGDVREIFPADAAHLVRSGVLAEMKAASPAVENKARKADENK